VLSSELHSVSAVYVQYEVSDFPNTDAVTMNEPEGLLRACGHSTALLHGIHDLFVPLGIYGNVVHIHCVSMSPKILLKGDLLKLHTSLLSPPSERWSFGCGMCRGGFLGQDGGLFRQFLPSTLFVCARVLYHISHFEVVGLVNLEVEVHSLPFIRLVWSI